MMGIYQGMVLSPSIVEKIIGEQGIIIDHKPHCQIYYYEEIFTLGKFGYTIATEIRDLLIPVFNQFEYVNTIYINS